MAIYITLEDIEDGMILSEPAINKFGNTLLPAGATLKTSHSNLLKTWNIKTLCIKGDNLEEDAELTSEQIEQAKERLNGRMNWSPRNELEKDLYNLGIIVAAKLNQKIN